MPPRILVADDQADVRESLRLLLKSEGFKVDTAGTPAAALAVVATAAPDLVLMDMNYGQDTTSGKEGLDLLERLQSTEPQVPVVVMTAWGSIELAVEAMRRGARDFIQKPWENARLLATVRTQLELSTALRRSQRLEAENAVLRGEGLPSLVAESRSMQHTWAVFVSTLVVTQIDPVLLGGRTKRRCMMARAWTCTLASRRIFAGVSHIRMPAAQRRFGNVERRLRCPGARELAEDHHDHHPGRQHGLRGVKSLDAAR